MIKCLRFIFASFHFDDWRHLVLAVQDRWTRQIHAQPEDESAHRRGQPVGFVTRRSRILDVNIDRAVGVLHETGTIADAVAVKRIRNKLIFRVPDRERPERIIRRKPACREVHDIVVRSGKLLARDIDLRRPVHRLLRYIDRSRKRDGARATHKDPIAGLAASVHGRPAVDLRDVGSREKEDRDKRQTGADQDALDDIQEDGSFGTKIPPDDGFCTHTNSIFQFGCSGY
jgi:hypothetical protein